MSVTDTIKYSPDLDIHLAVGGMVLRVAQVCREVLFLRDLAEVSSGEATLIVKVNGQEKSYTVVLPHGIKRDCEEVAFF